MTIQSTLTALLSSALLVGCSERGTDNTQNIEESALRPAESAELHEPGRATETHEGVPPASSRRDGSATGRESTRAPAARATTGSRPGARRDAVMPPPAAAPASSPAPSPVTWREVDDAGRYGVAAGAADGTLGGIVGGGKGATKGAAIGGAAGTGVVLATRGREVTLAAGTDIAATLAEPFSVRAPAR